MAKINLKRGLTDIVLYMIIFIVVQIIVMYAGAGIWAGIKVPPKERSNLLSSTACI